MPDTVIDPNLSSPASPPASPPVAPPWYAGLNDDHVGVLQTRGIHDKPAHEAIANLIEGYRNAEKVIGIPHDQVVRYNPQDEAVTKAFNKRIGVPDTVEGYDLTGLKLTDGTDPDADFLGFIRETSLRNGIPAAAAKSIAADLIKYVDANNTQDTTVDQAKAQAERQALLDNWGQRTESNMFIARSAAEKLGIAPEAVTALENAAGYKATMEMFLKLGLQMGEDKFITNQNPAAPGVFSREGATARLTELQADTGWTTKLMAGDAVTLREFRALTEIVAGVTGSYKVA